MKRTNINRLNAAITTTNFCDASAAETASITAFAILVLLIKSKIVIVQGFNQLGDAPTTGVTLNVKGIRVAMMQHTYRLGNATYAYAAGLTPPDEDLMAKSKLVVGKLEKLSKADCTSECDRIQKLAAAHAADILPYGASATDITDTASLVTLYMLGNGDPRAARITANNAKKQADLVLNNIMDNLLLKQLDPMANTLRYTNNSWWNQYHLSREVINLGVSHTKLNVFVKDQNGTAVQGATVSLVQNNIVVYTAVSGADGKLTIAAISPDTYDLRTEKVNFIRKEETGIQFKPGKHVRRTVTLVPAITIIRQGDVPSPGIVNINTAGINGTPLSTLLIEITGAPLRFYAAANPTDGPGAEYYDAQIGQAPFNLDDFKVAIGYGPGKQLLMVQNMGPLAAHFILTFSNLEP